MTLVQLRYAIYLQKYGSFKRAAEKLNITQPALSLQIQKLENEFGLSLFNRSNSPIQATPEGTRFLAQASEILAGIDHLHVLTQRQKDQLEGTLTLGIIPTLAPFLVPLFIDQLQSDYQKLKLDIHEMITEDVISEVRSGFLDAGLISTPVQVRGIQSIPVFYERFFFYSATGTGNYTQLENIDYRSLWLLNEGNCFRDQVNNFCDLKKIQKDRRFNYQSNSIDALIRIVDTKGGFTILPELTTLSLSESQEDRLTRIANKAREIGLITQKSNPKVHLTDRLISYIQNNIPANMRSSNKLEVVDPGIQMQ